MTDYDELARFRRKSGNTGFKLRPVEEAAVQADTTGNWRLLDEIAGQSGAAPLKVQAVSSQAVESTWQREDHVMHAREDIAAESGSLSLGLVDDVAVQQRRSQLAGLFRRPEPTPGPAPSAHAPTPLKPLLRRIAARHS